ncbi:PAS domain-containing sensor histidine kinase [Arcobacter sp. F2176]|uniref:PAS domain-containing sensor histidine kinase n=1 Tax=Arcobacter sp. F2176 TaxID=2044511 RepID=UPI00100AA796|nr:PAS domain-containing sensor histidine kinase [Arcobacter sp. F2176]RXJ79460.1 hypothetical protein CRU95_14045 [Arcobacter sp. F2176]
MKKVSSAFYIACIYFILSFFWILFSDKAILLLTQENQILTYIQTIKGWIFISITSIYLYFIISKEFKKEQDLKEYFKKSLDNLASPIIVFNEEGKVLTINKTFEKLTGYKYKEVDTIDKWTKLAYENNASNVKEIINSLYTINEIFDNGIFNIKTKSGKVLIWHFYSAPFGIRKGKRTIISNAVDITDIKNKEKIMKQQSKMAAMGEVLENIAHQWRQPLSNISAISTGIGLKNELKTLEEKEIHDSMNQINDSVQYLSKTIDDFRSFFKPSKEKTNFTIEETFEKSLMIIGSKFKNENIEFINEIDNIDIINDKNALIQVLINLFNNSKDAFIENNLSNRLIFIKTNIKDNKLIIEIKDNAGGVNESIINKIFEPYFTTKDKSLGTGIGLYMSEEIVVKHMQGEINVENIEFEYNEEKQKGAKFSIILPLKN